MVMSMSEGKAQVKKFKFPDNSERTKTNLAAFYLDSAQLLMNTAPLRAIDNINKAIELSIGNNDKTKEALAYWIFGNIEQNLEQHDLAVENYKKCINTLASGDDDVKSFSMNRVAKYSASPNQQLFNAYRSMSVSLLQLNKLTEANAAIVNCFQDQFESIDNADRLDAQRIHANILLKLGKSNESLDILNSTLVEERKQASSIGEAKTLMAIAALYQQIKKETKAIDYYEQAKVAAERSKNKDLLISINNALADIFRQQKNTSKELEIRNNTIAISSNSISKNKEINSNLFKVPAQEEVVLRESQTQDGFLSTSPNNSNSINNIGYSNSIPGIYTPQKNTVKEPGIGYNTAPINSTNSIDKNTGNTAYDLGNNVLDKEELSKQELAMNSATSKKEATYKLENITQQPLFNKSNDLEYTANTYKLQAEAFLKQGDNQQALAALKTFIEIQDSIKLIRKKELDQAIKISNALGKNRQRVDLLEKERDLSDRSIEVLKHDKELKEGELYTRNIIIGTLLFLIIFMLAGSYSIFKSFREKRTANQLLAIKSLRGQMNPHFIFNALNSVNQYISQNDERAANKYLSDFSKLMRAVMETSKHDLISLSEELDILKLYLQLEHSRFKDKFDYTFSIDTIIDASEFDLPPMIIQPFIENAVWHGLRYVDEKGLLLIDIKKTNEDLLITVSDNGIGRNKSMELKTKNQKLQHSTGMQNIESRIAIMNELFKTKINVTISDAYSSETNKGTRVEIFIPKKLNNHA